ncbi:serine hydrolase [Nonomuraea endophytica]|uniref:serine hydrolase n=1 Tax=Nonomuraea endophytica TaxID=714136 RepID=UPI0037C6A430
MRVRGISLITAFTVTMAACSDVEANLPTSAHRPAALAEVPGIARHPGDTVTAGFEPALRWPPTGLVSGSPVGLAAAPLTDTTAPLAGRAAIFPAGGVVGPAAFLVAGPPVDATSAGHAPGPPADQASVSPVGGSGSQGEVAGNGGRPLPDEVRGKLDRALGRYLASRPGRAAVAVYDRVAAIRYAYREREPFMLASVAKVDILLALALKAQEAGRRLTKSERSAASRMIRVSDNDCAHDLYRAIGGRDGLTAVLRELGIRRTWPEHSWGTTRSRPSDQVKVLERLTDPEGPLTAANRRFVLELMSSVVPDQAWGVSAAAGDGQVALKNGWLPASAHDGLWTVNSVGRLQTGGHDLLLAVLSERSPAMGYGVATVEAVARMVVKTMTKTATSTPPTTSR